VDTVLAAKGDRDEETNKVEASRLVVHKLRDGENGAVFPFAGKPVPMGVDEYGDPVSTLVIDWDVEASAPRASRPSTKGKSRSRRLMDEVLAEVLAEAGEIEVNGSGRVRAARREELGRRFRVAYMDQNRASYPAAKTRFAAAMEEMREVGGLREGQHEGEAYVWVDSLPGGP
jgi:hypothetical protein